MVRICFHIVLVAMTAGVGLAQCAKFEPQEDEILLFMGQDLGAVGGFEYPDNAGYHEQVGGSPSGITTYTGLPGLAGLMSTTNYGAGNICGQCILDNPIYDQAVLAIGLYLVDRLQKTAQGDYDDNIDDLANWVKSAERPVFLRIGYEFEYQYGSESPAQFVAAYRRIVDRFEALDVENCAFVWQAAAGTGSWSYLSQWYPGDEYVDWFGYSHFSYNGGTMIQKAREKGKPVMIAEATPIGWRLHEVNGNFAWNSWFKPMFDYIEANKDVIKALAYINQDWEQQWLWDGQNWGNSRVQDNAVVLQYWREEMAKDKWLMASSTLFDHLDNCGLTAIAEKNNTSVDFYPNPAADLLCARWGPDARWCRAVVCDLEGRGLIDQKFSTSNHVSINVEDLQPGTFSVTLSGESAPLTFSFIKL